MATALAVGVAPSDSTTTSTSHTLTNIPISWVGTQTAASMSATRPATATMDTLLESVAPARRSAYVIPTPSLATYGRDYAKQILDGFAARLGEEQAHRLQERRRKRKRGDMADDDDGELLRIRKIHVQGFDVNQVWAQAKRVIDALKSDTERRLRDQEAPLEIVEDAEDLDESESEELSETDLPRESADDMEDALLDDLEEDLEEDEIEEEEFEPENEEADEEDPEHSQSVYVADPHGLNDGFFSIDDFNKQTEFLERQDALADPYTGEASDEEDIDWAANPMSVPLESTNDRRKRKPTNGEDDEAGLEDPSDEESDDDEDGPTFGNMDLHAPEGDSEDDHDSPDKDDEAEDNTNDIMYTDFFEAPPRKAGRGERQANFLERQAKKAVDGLDKDTETNLERAMADVRRDLFDDESDHGNSEDALSDLDPADPKSRRSAHERKQAKLSEEIRKLEAASIAKRKWTLIGEAKAADRPMNSLLEEDMEFERTGKPIPVITAEVSEDIEALIKRRILAQEFDEVIRRRPDAESVPGHTRRGRFELDDSKPQQSLAEMYEEEHVKASNPDTYTSKAEAKQRSDEADIDLLWKDVSAKLDALCSWHYKPKAAAPSLTVVNDLPTIAMEDAQPSTASGLAVAGNSMLAPQEIYSATTPAGAAPIAREEMTREQKLRRRRREKERIRKRGGNDDQHARGAGASAKTQGAPRPISKRAAQRKQTVNDLAKGGVKIIGKRGELVHTDGTKVVDTPGRNAAGAGGYKL